MSARGMTNPGSFGQHAEITCDAERASEHTGCACLAVVTFACRRPLPQTTGRPAHGNRRRRHGGLRPGDPARSKSAVAYRVRGMARRDKGDLDRAVADFDQAIRLDPKNTNAYITRGIAWATEGDLDRAIADNSQVIRQGLVQPNHTDA